jgi:DNA-binding GntR family transcriptional regulator
MQLKGRTRSEIYTSILRAVIKGEYPPGRRLVEQDLATAYNVSRTPIREVLVARRLWNALVCAKQPWQFP